MGGPNAGSQGFAALVLDSNTAVVEYALTDVVAIGSAAASPSINGGYGVRIDGSAGQSITTTIDRSRLRAGHPGGRALYVGADEGSTSVLASVLEPRETGIGVEVLSAGPVTLEDSVIQPGPPVMSVNSEQPSGLRHVGPGRMTLVRSRITADAFGMLVESGGSPADPPSVVEVIDSTVQATQTAARVATLPSDSPARLEARGATFLVRGADAQYGVEVARSNPTSAEATGDLRNTITRVEDSSQPNTADLTSRAATLTADFSSFSTVDSQEGGAVPEPGSASNVSGDPLLDANLALDASSPLIDRGDPSIVEPGQLDLAGAARSLDGNGDCVAAPDIGAFELTGRAAACPEPPGPPGPPGPVNGLPPVNVAPTVTGVSMTNRVFAPVPLVAGRRRVARGTTFRYTLSEPAQVVIRIERRARGRRARNRRCVKPTRSNRDRRRCVRWVRRTTLRTAALAGPGSTPFSGRVRTRALRRGRYRARLVAADAQGARSAESRLRFRIVRGGTQRRP